MATPSVRTRQRQQRKIEMERRRRQARINAEKRFAQRRSSVVKKQAKAQIPHNPKTQYFDAKGNLRQRVNKQERKVRQDLHHQGVTVFQNEKKQVALDTKKDFQVKSRGQISALIFISIVAIGIIGILWYFAYVNSSEELRNIALTVTLLVVCGIIYGTFGSQALGGDNLFEAAKKFQKSLS